MLSESIEELQCVSPWISFGLWNLNKLFLGQKFSFCLHILDFLNWFYVYSWLYTNTRNMNGWEGHMRSRLTILSCYASTLFFLASLWEKLLPKMMGFLCTKNYSLSKTIGIYERSKYIKSFVQILISSFMIKVVIKILLEIIFSYAVYHIHIFYYFICQEHIKICMCNIENQKTKTDQFYY